MENCRVFIDQKPENYSKCTVEINTTEARYLNNQIADIGTNELCNIPAGNSMFKVNNRNTRTRCEICLKLTIKIPERRHR